MVASTIPGSSWVPGPTHRRHRRSAEPCLGRASRRRLSREQREGTDAPTPPSAGLCCRAAPFGPRIRSTRACSSRAGADRARATPGLSRRAVSPLMRKAMSGLRGRAWSRRLQVGAAGPTIGLPPAATQRRAPVQARHPRRPCPAMLHASVHAMESSSCRSARRGKMDGSDSQTTLNRPSAVA